MIVSESRISFDFGPNYTDVVKYDSTPYYLNLFSAQEHCKGVDFIALSNAQLLLIEVKNCFGNEADNRWRIANNNAKSETIPTGHDITDRDSLDVEVAEKIRMTIAALTGVHTAPNPASQLIDCKTYANALCSEDIGNGRIKLVALLVLDGNFGCKTRDDNMIRKEIQKSIKKKLKWLNCEVLVVDSNALTSARMGVSAHRV